MSDLGQTVPVVPPLYQSSVYSIPDLDVIDRIYGGAEAGYIYARDAHPNARLLEQDLARLEGAVWAVVCGSGMAALTAALVSLARQGDKVLASDRLYGRSTQLMVQELSRFGVETVLVDANDLDAVGRSLANNNPRLMIVETMSNPLLRVADVPGLAGLCRAHGCPLLVDNTFATPVLCRPLEQGADLVHESITKMIGGHADVTLGAVCGQGTELEQRMRQVMTCWGLASSPFECWLAGRGLVTLPVRMRAASANARALADWLAGQRGVGRVIYPGRADHPDHDLAGRLFGTEFGNMLCFELTGGRDAVNRFMRLAPAISFSPSLGHAHTTCSHPASTSHRFAGDDERRRQGITAGLIRLSVGIEPLEQICAEMARGIAG
jgi:cystathionine beta-lyase/cystathionine gamma-synthase